MNDKEIKIIVLRIVKTKTNKTLLQYATPDGEGAYYKGFTILDQWLDDTKLFNNFDISNIGIPLNAHFEYQKTFKRGMAQMVLTDIYNDNGEILFEL